MKIPPDHPGISLQLYYPGMLLLLSLPTSGGSCCQLLQLPRAGSREFDHDNDSNDSAETGGAWDVIYQDQDQDDDEGRELDAVSSSPVLLSLERDLLPRPTDHNQHQQDCRSTAASLPSPSLSPSSPLSPPLTPPLLQLLPLFTESLPRGGGGGARIGGHDGDHSRIGGVPANQLERTVDRLRDDVRSLREALHAEIQRNQGLVASAAPAPGEALVVAVVDDEHGYVDEGDDNNEDESTTPTREASALMMDVGDPTGSQQDATDYDEDSQPSSNVSSGFHAQPSPPQPPLLQRPRTRSLQWEMVPSLTETLLRRHLLHLPEHMWPATLLRRDLITMAHSSLNDSFDSDSPAPAPSSSYAHAPSSHAHAHAHRCLFQQKAALLAKQSVLQSIRIREEYRQKQEWMDAVSAVHIQKQMTL